MNLKAYIADREFIVANENVSSITARDKINSQFTEVRNLLKIKYYNKISSEQAEPIQTNDNQLSAKSMNTTAPAIETPERTT